MSNKKLRIVPPSGPVYNVFFVMHPRLGPSSVSPPMELAAARLFLSQLLEAYRQDRHTNQTKAEKARLQYVENKRDSILITHKDKGRFPFFMLQKFETGKPPYVVISEKIIPLLEDPGHKPVIEYYENMAEATSKRAGKLWVPPQKKLQLVKP